MRERKIRKKEEKVKKAFYSLVLRQYSFIVLYINTSHRLVSKPGWWWLGCEKGSKRLLEENEETYVWNSWMGWVFVWMDVLGRKRACYFLQQKIEREGRTEEAIGEKAEIKRKRKIKRARWQCLFCFSE